MVRYRKYWFMVLILFATILCIGYVIGQRETTLAQGDMVIRKDAENKSHLPKSFRMLENLKASGSAQYSAESLAYMKGFLPREHVILVDLRQESHGFINGIPVSWYKDRNWANLGKPVEEVQKDEQLRLADTKKRGEIQMSADVKKEKKIETASKKAEVVSVNDAYTEETLAEQIGFGYVRLAITDHRRPSDMDVDVFVDFIRTLPPSTWLHFHCEAGHGRTTTFLTMYDMMLHAKEESLEAIVGRQYEAGGINLFSQHKKDWRIQYDEEREKFIKNFYQYCQQNHDAYATSWSSWAKKMNP